MPDPIILDTNVLKDISRGNTPAAEALKRYLSSGTPVYISKAAYEELVTRAETPQLGGQYREMLSDLGIKVAPPGAAADRGNFYADNIQHKPAPNKPGQIKEYDRKNDPTKPGDVFVAAQTKALKGKLWTFDGDLAKRAAQLGVQLAPETENLKGMSGPEDADRGRQLLGLNPKPVGTNGQVIRTGNPAGGNSGTYAMEGVADNTLPEFVGPSPKGQAIVGGIQLAFEGINFALNLINDRIQKGKVDAALNTIRPQVAKARTDNPRLGVLLMFYYTQVQAPEESIMKPGAAFDYVIWGQGVTADEARMDALKTPTISRGVGPNERRFPQEVWIPPMQKTSITTAKSPFKPVGVGRFWLGNSNQAKFQLVSFDVFGGFDDIREKSIDLPKGTNADFAVLNPPTEVYWYNMNGKQKVGVPLKDGKTANTNTIKVVDLDPYSPFNAAAAMVFPMTDWAEEVFNVVSPTDGWGNLGTYANFKMIRWVRAENIHLLRFV